MFLLDNSLLEPLIRRWTRRAPLTDQDVAAIQALPGLRRSFDKDGYLVREGEQPANCALLLRGFVYRQKFVGEGARQIIALHIPGEFVDLQNCLLPVADHNVQSLDRSEVALIARSALLDLAASRPALARAMWFDTMIDASIAREWMVNVGRRAARSRIAHLLCELALRLDAVGLGLADNGGYRFPFTQEQLADATDITAVHTNRTLQSLRREGLIRLGSNTLTVLDWDRLCQVGDFNPRYLHHGRVA